LEIVVAAVAQKRANRFGVRVQINQDLLDAVASAEVQPYLEQWNSPNRHQALRNRVGYGPQSRSVSRSEQESLHERHHSVGKVRDSKRVVSEFL
jgi:hypothetical protein